jgi:putative DNA-invertase from lambdoid prophage Rac
MRYAIAYVRVSTEEQTVLNQKMAIERWAFGQDYQIVYYFEDSAVSGKIPAVKRHAFHDMLELIKIEPVDAVLIYELSRVGRNFWDTLDAIKAVEEYSPIISCSPKESFLQSTEPGVRKLMIGILTWVAERERELLVQRTKDGMRRAKESGKGIGRPVKNVDKNTLIQLLAENTPRTRIANVLRISKARLYKELNDINGMVFQSNKRQVNSDEIRQKIASD